MGEAKIDNFALAPKLEVRRQMLRKHHEDAPLRVFDACQGNGVLWTRLRSEFPIASYWGVDLKERKGRLRIDSVRILAQPGWNFDVIDIDTYGAPWKHYAALLANLRAPATVFLTVGSASFTGAMDNEAIRVMGLTPLRPLLAQGFLRKVTPMALEHLVAMCYNYSVAVPHAVRAAAGRATYYGLRLVPERT